MNTSAKLQSLIDNLKNGEALNLNGEDFYLDKRIIISGKKDVVIYDGNDEKITGLHKNIKIVNNIFKRMRNNMITVSSSVNVEVHGNRFVSRGEKEIPAVKFISCREVTEKDNSDI